MSGHLKVILDQLSDQYWIKRLFFFDFTGSSDSHGNNNNEIFSSKVFSSSSRAGKPHFFLFFYSHRQRSEMFKPFKVIQQSVFLVQKQLQRDFQSACPAHPPRSVVQLTSAPLCYIGEQHQVCQKIAISLSNLYNTYYMSFFEAPAFIKFFLTPSGASYEGAPVHKILIFNLYIC